MKSRHALGSDGSSCRLSVHRKVQLQIAAWAFLALTIWAIREFAS